MNARFRRFSSGALGVLVLAQSAMAQVCFEADPPTNVGLFAQDLLGADLDGDGDTDLVATDSGVHVVSVLLNHGNGTFAPYTQYSAGLHALAMTGADLDADGDKDLAVASWFAGTVSVLLNQGNGTFGADVQYGVGSGTTGITSADFDGDGDIDVATSNQLSDTVSVLLNQGQGSFAPQVQYAAGDILYGVTSADLDGDGDVDLAVANLFDGTVSVLLNRGNGTFAAPLALTVGTNAFYVINADLNADGRADLVALDDSNDCVAVRRNQGGGAFAPYVTYPVARDPQRVVATDLDEDGDLDLAVATIGFGSESVSLLLNHGNGTFAPFQEIAAGTVYLPVTHGDFDGDGDRELAMANLGAQIVTVYRNCLNQGISYCFGDGSLTTACPCAPPNIVPNPPAAPGHGCANSLNLDGARLSATGTRSPDAIKFDAFISPTNVAFGLLLKGNANARDGIANADGIRCVDGALIRFGGHFASTNGAAQGHWTYPNTVQTLPVSIQTAQPPAQTAYYQYFYRNVLANFCTAATTNWSNGIQIAWP